MHFWVSATRAGFHDDFCCPRKIGTNWFMPAFVKSKLGASGKSGDDGTIVCFFSRKKSRNDCRIWAEVMIPEIKRDIQRDARTTATRSRRVCKLIGISDRVRLADNFGGEAFHFFKLRAALQEKQIDTCFLEFRNPRCDLIGGADEVGT